MWAWSFCILLLIFTAERIEGLSQSWEQMERFVGPGNPFFFGSDCPCVQFSTEFGGIIQTLEPKPRDPTTFVWHSEAKGSPDQGLTQ